MRRAVVSHLQLTNIFPVILEQNFLFRRVIFPGGNRIFNSKGFAYYLHYFLVVVNMELAFMLDAQIFNFAAIKYSFHQKCTKQGLTLEPVLKLPHWRPQPFLCGALIPPVIIIAGRKCINAVYQERAYSVQSLESVIFFKS